MQITWPDGKRFAFSVFDDTDLATLANVGPVYAFLAERGMRTTKSVWPIAGPGAPILGGDTCENEAYLRWLLGLQEQGFEIGLHCVTYHTSTREEVLRGLDAFRRSFHGDPRTFTNHSETLESIYWNAARLSGIHALLFKLLTGFEGKKQSQGHVEGNPHFWGDLCKERVKYVRNFVFRGVNTLQSCPFMPYHDPARPYVNYWFASSEGANCRTFNQTISEENQDLLEEEGGACIMYTHFAAGFAEDGRLDPRFQQLVERLTRKNGWFVPVADLLDHILATRGHHELTPSERMRLERRWLLHKIRTGRT